MHLICWQYDVDFGIGGFSDHITESTKSRWCKHQASQLQYDCG